MAGRVNVPKWERTLRAVEQPPKVKPVSAKAPLLDVEGAAAYLNVSETFVRRMVRLRKIRHTKLGGSSIRFTQEDLDAFIEAGRVEPTA